MTLTEAEVDLIEGDGERNFINWLCERGPEDPFGIDRKELYARYLADKPDFVSSDGGTLTREDGRLMLEALAAQKDPVRMFYSPFSGRSLADIVRSEAPEPLRFPQVFKQSKSPRLFDPEDQPDQPA